MRRSPPPPKFRRRWLAATALVASVLGVGTGACGSEDGSEPLADVSGTANVASNRTGLHNVDFLPSEPRWPNAIGGQERLLGVGGEVVASVEFPADSEALTLADVALNEQSHDAAAPLFVPVQGIGSIGGQVHEYTYLLRVGPNQQASAELGAEPVLQEESPIDPTISPPLEEAMLLGGPSDEYQIYISMRTRPQTSLRRFVSSHDAVAFSDREPNTARSERIATRISEVRSQHSLIRARLRGRGIPESKLVSLWLTGGLAGRLAREDILALASDPAVRSIAWDRGTKGAVANTWDGTNVSNGETDGLNVHHYRSAGYNGAGWNQVDGRWLRLGLIGDGFYFDHSIFKDWQNGPSRFVKNWDCRGATCTEIFTPLNTGNHETKVASAAAGDALQNQVPALTTSADQLDHTGVAREADLYSAEATSFAEGIAALQRMTTEGVDVVNLSRGDYDVDYPACDYDSLAEDWSFAVKAAHDLGVLVVVSAGNVSNTWKDCSVTRWAQAPSAFAVSGVLDPLDNYYWVSDINPDYADGGLTATVSNGSYYVYRFDALSAVDAVVPGSWRYGATTPDNFVLTGGTSLAAPQVSGAAMLVKSSLLSGGITYIDSPGVLFTTMLAMTDRADGFFSKKSSGFSPSWGGGRMQLRYFMGPDDHPAGGGWGWDAWETPISQGQVLDFPVRGLDAEPSTIRLFKVYAVVFEDYWHYIANVDIEIRDKNCGAGSVVLGSDSSYDTKSMARVGQSAAGKQLCVRVKGTGVPPEGRRVVLVSYFSVDTMMR